MTPCINIKVLQGTICANCHDGKEANGRTDGIISVEVVSRLNINTGAVNIIHV